MFLTPFPPSGIRTGGHQERQNTTGISAPMQVLTKRAWHIATIVLISTGFYFSIVGRNTISHVLLTKAKVVSDVASGKLATVPLELEDELNRLVKRSDLFQTIGARLCVLSVITFVVSVWRREPSPPWHNGTVVALTLLVLLQFLMV